MTPPPARRRFLLAAATAALLGLVVFLLPSIATAGERSAASLEEAMHLHGTHGFQISVDVVDHKFLEVEAKKRVGLYGRVSVTYLDDTKSGPGERIDTELTGVGHIDASFVPESSRSLPVPYGCKGGGSTVEKGYFVGAIELRGERGYTRVRRTRVPGTVKRKPARVCSFSNQGSERAVEHIGGGPGRVVSLFTGSHSSAPILEASRFEAPGHREESFRAYADSRRGELDVLSIASFEAPIAAGFTVAAEPEPSEEATLSPPAPFSGSGRFRLSAPTHASWTGDLAVRMPNLGRVRLTGRGMYVGLCRDGTCTKTFPPGDVFVQPAPES